MRTSTRSVAEANYASTLPQCICASNKDDPSKSGAAETAENREPLSRPAYSFTPHKDFLGLSVID